MKKVSGSNEQELEGVAVIADDHVSRKVLNQQDTKERKRKGFSVSAKLNIVNVLIIVSGVLSIIGAYEVQLGGKLHELNYFHQKYITFLIKSVEEFESDDASLLNVEEYVNHVKQQPIDCLALVGPVEKVMMKMIGTYEAINVCEEDLLIADSLLASIDKYEAGNLEKSILISRLHWGIQGFENSGVLFEPLVGKTVRITFLTVITIIVGKAFIVPLFGLVLSSSVARDYKALVKTKKNLEELQRKNEIIQKEKVTSLTTLSAGIAHEINTPVGVSITANSYSKELIDNISDSYQQGKLTEDDLSNFFKEMNVANKVIQDSLTRTSSLVESFKTISSDQSTEEIKEINIKQYIEQILLSLSPITKRLDISININCPEGLVAYLCPGSVSQIITNLTTNSVVHGFKGKQKGEITISVEKCGNNIHMKFSDDGQGISKDNLPYIFDPFFTTGRCIGGTGLGLHIINRIITENLNGNILCVSELGKGTTFDINFPESQRS